MDAQLDVFRMTKTQDIYPILELTRYLNEHRDVVCTIFDGGAGGQRQLKKLRKEIPRNLPVPVVVVR
jgi:chemotaxis response regulator CheB